MFMALTGATHAFAQGQNGILTGTVTDDGGVVPGAMVVATDPAHGPHSLGGVRTIRASSASCSLPAGRYGVRVEMAGFRQITLSDVMLLSGETRDLGRLVLEVGTLAEARDRDGRGHAGQYLDRLADQRSITGDQLTMIQVKGRDIFGMMKILPGVSDTTFSRDYASWQSGRGLSINGANSLNKNTTIDGVPVGEEGGDGTTHVTPNIDAIGEVTVITNGYTAENGRQSSGLIRIVTKSGTNQIPGLRLVQRAARRVERERLLPQEAGRREAVLRGQHLRLQHRRPGRHPEARRQPHEREEVLLLPLAGVRRRRAPDERRPHQPADCGRAQRAISRKRRNPNGTGSSRSWTRDTGQPFPGNIIPQNQHQLQWARRCSTCCRCRTASSTSRPARSAPRTTRRTCNRFTSGRTS